jgi:hypothetical protein
MLYITCPTCGYFLGQITFELEQEKEKICSNPTLSPENKEKNISELLLRLLKNRPSCCKMRAMTYKDITLDILPYSS